MCIILWPLLEGFLALNYDVLHVLQQNGRHVADGIFMGIFIQNNIDMLVPGVSSSVENRSCPKPTRCCSECVIPLSWCQSVFDGWVMAEWLGRCYNNGRRRVSLRFWGPRFATGIHFIKQFAHKWYLPCCQCTEVCYHVSFIQHNMISYTASLFYPFLSYSCVLIYVHIISDQLVLVKRRWQLMKAWITSPDIGSYISFGSDNMCVGYTNQYPTIRNVRDQNKRTSVCNYLILICKGATQFSFY